MNSRLSVTPGLGAGVADISSCARGSEEHAMVRWADDVSSCIVEPRCIHVHCLSAMVHHESVNTVQVVSLNKDVDVHSKETHTSHSHHGTFPRLPFPARPWPISWNIKCVGPPSGAEAASQARQGCLSAQPDVSAVGPSAFSGQFVKILLCSLLTCNSVYFGTQTNPWHSTTNYN